LVAPFATLSLFFVSFAVPNKDRYNARPISAG